MGEAATPIATESFVEGIKTMTEQDIKLFFDSFAAIKLEKMKTKLTERELTDLNANVSMISEIKSLVLKVKAS